MPLLLKMPAFISCTFPDEVLKLKTVERGIVKGVSYVF
jgi:hypothetical protein